MAPLRCREELRVEDGAWVEAAGPSELLAVLASGPIVPSGLGMPGMPDLLPTADFVGDVLRGQEIPRDVESLLDALHRRTSDERLLSAAAAAWRTDMLEIAWIGDVRAHLIRGTRLVASTRDDTLANELVLLGDCGDNPAVQRIVTRTLGGPAARPHTQRWSLRPGDALLLCASHVHEFRPPARYLDDALDFTRPLPGRLLVEHCVEQPAEPPRPVYKHLTMALANPKVRDHDFLRMMYDDGYFPDALVDEGKAILIDLCHQIEAQRPKSPAQVFALTHAATEAFNALDEQFHAQGSEIETAARDCIATEFEFILTAYDFDVDLEEALAPRDW